jgi:hypothetical protein
MCGVDVPWLHAYCLGSVMMLACGLPDTLVLGPATAAATALQYCLCDTPTVLPVPNRTARSERIKFMHAMPG